MNSSHQQEVIDFPTNKFENSEESEPEPAGYIDFVDLRNHAATIRTFAQSVTNQTEHLVHVGQEFYLHLFSHSDSFGIYGKNPESLGRLALQAPLVTTGMYLRMPPESRSVDGYVAGLVSKRVSCRSIRHIIGLCAEFIDERTDQKIQSGTLRLECID